MSLCPLSDNQWGLMSTLLYHTPNKGDDPSRGCDRLLPLTCPQFSHYGKYSFPTPKTLPRHPPKILNTIGLQQTIKPKQLILYSQTAWNQNKLNNGSHWPKEHIFNFNVLHDLDDFCYHRGKWSEIPSMQVFFAFRAIPLTRVCGEPKYSHPAPCQQISYLITPLILLAESFLLLLPLYHIQRNSFSLLS